MIADFTDLIGKLHRRLSCRCTYKKCGEVVLRDASALKRNYLNGNVVDCSCMKCRAKLTEIKAGRRGRKKSAGRGGEYLDGAMDDCKRWNQWVLKSWRAV